MKIKPIVIQEKLSPFTHKISQWLWLPETPYLLRIFYARLEIWDMRAPFSPLQPRGKLSAAFSFNLPQPVQDFKATLDLERRRVEVGMQTSQGYFLYRVFASGEAAFVAFKKKPASFSASCELTPDAGWHCQESESGSILAPLAVSLKAAQKKQEESMASSSLSQTRLPKISFGMNKQLKLEKIESRNDLREILPLWHRLGVLSPKSEIPSGGTVQLLERCQNLLEEKAHDHLQTALKTCFQIGLNGLFLPTLYDENYQIGQGLQGLSAPQAQQSSACLHLFKRGSALIERLFLEAEGDTITLLAHPLFPCGRVQALSVSLPGGFKGFISFEWSRFRVRRVQIETIEEGELTLATNPHLKSFRSVISQKKCCLFSQNNKIYCTFGKQQNFDRFQY
ncbi:MAG: hypothetical protein K0S07_1557 [Chlamydiales bacterium]|jgi:hypothetical protein|nr:hypothetical protein [Chlamydiales bacterium]